MDTAQDIIDQARAWLDDEVEPFLYSSSRLLKYTDEAQTEACLRMRLKVDSTTAALCTITLVEGQRSYSLHEAIIVPRRVQYRPTDTTMRHEVLDRTTWDWLDNNDRHWQQLTGQPHRCVLDIEQRTLTLDREPTATTLGTLALTVLRRPLPEERLLTTSRAPIVPLEHRLWLAHWTCYRALLTKDGELGDEKRAAAHLTQFEQHFGPRPTAGQLRALATDDAGEITAYHY